MNLLVAVLFAAVSPPSGAPGVPLLEKLHPYLVERMLTVGSDESLPVYFVIGDRLGYEHWFPRVQRLPLAERRALVVRELREHAELTQRELLATLRDLGARCEIVSENWLGNFVRVRATPDVILAAAALGSVAEVWFDREPPLSEVEDAVPALPGAGGLPPTSPGNGPADSRADLLWGLGINGAGMVIMNTDSGINVTHSDLAGRLWVNPGEIAGNGVDDDGNGKIDDINGWNFGGNNSALSDSGGHGTNTSGCLVADGTCTGVGYGQAPGARIITGRLTGESSQWDAIQYGLLMGADLQTSSHSYKNADAVPPNYRMHRDVSDNTLAAGLVRTNSTSNNGTSCTSTTSRNRRPFNISAPGNCPPPYLDPAQTLVGRKSGVIGVGAYTVGTNTQPTYTPCGPFAWSLADVLAVNPTFPAANWDAPADNDYPWSGGTQIALIKPDVCAATATTTTSGTGTCGTAVFSGTSNSTPNACGIFTLWKSANPSLTPEDIAMVAHQSATNLGAPGKENTTGAGKLDARNGLDLALCVHRVNGEPAWTVDVTAGSTVDLALDTIPNAVVIVAVGATRTASQTWGGVIGIAPLLPELLFPGTADASGDHVLSIPVPASLAGIVAYTQCGTLDTSVTGTPGAPRLLTSNVVGIRIN